MDKDPAYAVDTRFHVESLARSAQALAVIAEQDPELREVMLGYVKFLLGEKPRAYPALASYLELYGEKYLLPEIDRVLQGKLWSQIIELGPGTGWLIKQLGRVLQYGGHRIAIDKRETLFVPHNAVHFLAMDLEEHSSFLGQEDPEGTLIVANQFLHCVDNWREIIKGNRADWLVVEVSSLIWKEQLRKFGASPLMIIDIIQEFEKAGYKLVSQKPTSLLHVSLWRPV